ncbi:hypothetical protein OIU35_31430 [Boseaceae bacterium BT-24-1]|nr:hypothetical protein [Boseaceae bacterium BT-24-1]
MSPEQEEAILKFMNTPRAFVRVYEMPDKLTNGYCFGGGVPITFMNVDWFEHPIGDRTDLETFIKSKRYYNPAKRFLVQSDEPNFTFTLAMEADNAV